ncbi:MAG: ABC transporter permease [Acidimicrobiales bacterium]
MNRLEEVAASESARDIEPPATAEVQSDGVGRSGRLGTTLTAVGLLVGIIVVWDLSVRTGLVHSVVLPAPRDVLSALGELLRADFLAGHLWATVSETIVGFAVASVAGFVVGSVLVFFSAVRRAVYPYIVVFQTLPKVALAPLIVAWLGFGVSSKIGLAAAIAFFPVLINTMVGLQSVPVDSVLLMRSLVASRRRTFFSLALPWALPSIFAGLKTSMTLALIGAIVAEFVGARKGLAVLIDTFSFQFRMDSVYAVLIVLGAVGLLLYGVVEYADRRIVFWRDNPHDA